MDNVWWTAYGLTMGVLLIAFAIYDLFHTERH